MITLNKGGLAVLVLLVALSGFALAETGSGSGSSDNEGKTINTIEAQQKIEEKLASIKKTKEKGDDDVSEKLVKIIYKNKDERNRKEIKEKIAMERDGDRDERKEEFRLRLETRLKERDEIISIEKKCDQLVRRVEYVWKIAQEEGRTELAEKLKAILTQIQNACTDDDVSDTDKKDADDTIWEHHSKRLIEKVEKILTKAESISARLTRALNRMDDLEKRLPRDTKNSVIVRLDNIQEKATKLKAKLDKSIAQTKAKLGAFKADPTKENGRELHKGAIRTKVYAKHAVNALRYWVSLFNHIKDRKERPTADVAPTSAVQAAADTVPIDGVAAAVDAAVPTEDKAKIEAEIEAETEAAIALYPIEDSSTTGEPQTVTGGEVE